jgi:hypothetical protein
VRKTFNLQEAIPAAWELLWQDNLKQRAENEKRAAETGKESYGAGRTFYLTATDVEDQVRMFAQEEFDGKPWGSTGRSYGSYPNGIRISGDVFGDVRKWLLHNPNLQEHNFGRGHISGMRFRPVGEVLSAAEQATLAAKEKAKANRAAGKLPPVHFRKGSWGSAILCAKRGPFSRSNYRSHGPRGTNVAAEVTCPRCKNLLEKTDK